MQNAAPSTLIVDKQKEQRQNAAVFRQMLRGPGAISDATLTKLIRNYVADSDHSNWEGFSSRDRTGIERMFADMFLYFISEDFS